MESLPTEQNDIEKLNAEPATGFGAATPVQPTPTPTQPAQNTLPQAPKKSHKRRNIIIAIIILVLLAAGAVTAIWIFSRPKKSPAKEMAPQVVKPLDDAQGMIQKINTALTNETTTSYQPSQIQFTTPTSTPPAASPSYQIANADYYVTTSQSYGLTITEPTNTNSGATNTTDANNPVDTTFTQGIIDQVDATFTSSQYHETTTLASSTEYQSDSVICTVSLADTMPVSVACANKDDYTKVSSDLQPFVTAYRASNPSDNSESVYSEPNIKSSSVSGYQNATVSISSRQSVGGAALLFYRKGTNDWQFFKATQDEIGCSEYSTADLKAAFAGTSCASSNGTESTVGATTSSTQQNSSSSNTNQSSNSTSNSSTTYNTTTPATNQ